MGNKLNNRSETETALRQKAKELLENNEVGYVIGWGSTRFEDRTVPIFVRTVEDADKLLWNEYCVNGLAKYVLDDVNPEKKVGICARGCDSRAINRLIQDNQLKRENVYIIGLPCDGKKAAKCDACTHRNPVLYDVLIGEPVEEQPVTGRFKEVEEMEKLSPEERYEYWVKQYDKCIRCYACRNVCPACNCRECYADQYKIGWQGKQNNSIENQIFGITRAYHVGDRCIECGECERVCPMGLPLMKQNRKMLKDINELFGEYECGIDTGRAPVLGSYSLDDPDEFI